MRGIAQDRFAAGHPPIGNLKGRAVPPDFYVARPRICFGMSFVLAPGTQAELLRQNGSIYWQHALAPHRRSCQASSLP